ncbi:MAG: hypothetical protein ACK41T_10270 [Pseudobdellovibrio sp.]
MNLLTLFLISLLKDILSFRSSLGWKQRQQTDYGKGNFIKPQARDNAAEDFANNVEAYLFENEILKEIVPPAYNWILKKYGKNFKLKEKWENEK